jgi:hypothetical protein
MNNPYLITSALKVVGGLLIMFAAIISKSTAASWAKKLFSLAGFTAFCGGLFVLIAIYYGQTMDPKTIRLLYHYKTFVDGIAVGLLVALFSSGELNLSKWRKRKIAT